MTKCEPLKIPLLISNMELLALEHTFLPNDFVGDLRSVSEQCGVHHAMLLQVRMPGIDLFIPQSGKTALDAIYIKEHYDGTNALSIAVRLGIDSSRVKELAKGTRAYNFPSTSASLRHVFDQCGEDTVRILCEHFPKQFIRIPRRGIDVLKRKYIQQNFNGSNVVDLAIQLGVTDRFVRMVVADGYKSRVLQLDLFNS